MISKGRVCVKFAGRDTGICVVIDEDKKQGRVQVFGPDVRKRWVNPTHLEAVKKTLDIKLTEAKMKKELEAMSEDFKASQIEAIDLLEIKAKSRAK